MTADITDSVSVFRNVSILLTDKRLISMAVNLDPSMNNSLRLCFTKEDFPIFERSYITISMPCLIAVFIASFSAFLPIKALPLALL